MEDTCDKKEDRNLSHLSTFGGDGNVLQVPCCSRVQVMGCHLPFSVLRPLHWLFCLEYPVPTPAHDRFSITSSHLLAATTTFLLLILGFCSLPSLCLLAFALAKTEPYLSLEAHSQALRERACIGSIGHCYLCWGLVSCGATSKASTAVRGVVGGRFATFMSGTNLNPLCKGWVTQLALF